MLKPLKINLSPRFQAYIALMRLDKPVGIFLLLWPALWGLLLAQEAGLPSLGHVVIFSLGTLLMRSAGCAINDFADRNIDGKVARTATRPLALKQVQPWEALTLAAVLSGLAFCLVLLTNSITILMSFGGVILAGLYPFTKRWIASPQLVLGVAFAWAIPMGFAATLETVPAQGWYYFLVTLFWIFGYDTYYAMADREDDRFLNIGSTALLFGRYAGQVSFACTLLFILGFFLLLHSLTNYPLLILVFGFCVCLGVGVYQYSLAKTDTPENYTKAFKLSNILGFVLTFVLILGALSP